jgi:hypothetical protein
MAGCCSILASLVSSSHPRVGLLHTFFLLRPIGEGRAGVSLLDEEISKVRLKVPQDLGKKEKRERVTAMSGETK